MVNLENIDFEELSSQFKMFLVENEHRRGRLSIVEAKKFIISWLSVGEPVGTLFNAVASDCLLILKETGLFDIVKIYDNPFSNVKAKCLKW